LKKLDATRFPGQGLGQNRGTKKKLMAQKTTLKILGRQCAVTPCGRATAEGQKTKQQFTKTKGSPKKNRSVEKDYQTTEEGGIRKKKNSCAKV